MRIGRYYGTTGTDGKWRRCTSVVPQCMGRAARDSCTCMEPPPGSVQEMLEETDRRARQEERAILVKQIRDMHADLQAGNAAPMGYDALASVLEEG